MFKIFIVGLTFSHHSFIQRCQGKLDFMKGDGIDERILKHTKKRRQLRCLLMLTLSVTSLLRASLFQSDWGREKKMTVYDCNLALCVSTVEPRSFQPSSSFPSFSKLCFVHRASVSCHSIWFHSLFWRCHIQSGQDLLEFFHLSCILTIFAYSSSYLSSL